MRILDTSQTWKTGFFIVTAMAPLPELGLFAAAKGAPAPERALTAADLGLSGRGITALAGTVTNAGATRIINVGYVEATKGALVSQLRGALPNVLSAARAEGVKVLQVTGTFANADLRAFVGSQTARLGGTISSAGGVETLTFLF